MLDGSHFHMAPEMFSWVQVWALAGSLKDIQKVVLKPLLCYLDCVRLLSWWNMNHCSRKKSRALWSKFSSRVSLCLAAFIFPPILTSLPVPAAETHPRSMMMPPPCQPGDERCLLTSKNDAWPCAIFFLIRLENCVSHGLRVFHMSFGKLQVGCHVPFPKDWLPSSHSIIQAWFTDCCIDDYPSGGTDIVTIVFLVTFLTKALLPRLLWWSASSRKSLSGSELLPLIEDGGHCLHWDLQNDRNFCVPFPRFVPKDNPVSEVNRWFLLVFAWFMHWHTLSTVGPYKSCPIN